MHQNKGIEKLAELRDFFTSGEKASDTLIDMLKVTSNSPLTTFLNRIKKRGVYSGDLLSLLLIFPFAGISSVRSLFFSGLSQISPAKKDAYYRFKNNSSINWRTLLRIIAKRILKIVNERGENTGIKCLILDDTLLMKTSRFSEGVSKIYDHAKHGFFWGYRLLQIGLWDGKSFIPLDFTLHREKGSNKKKPFGMTITQKREQFKKKRDNKSEGAKRKKELDKKKTKMAIQMLGRAVKNGFKAEYVLADSWFFNSELLRFVREIGNGSTHLISMAKFGKTKYVHKGKLINSKELKHSLRGSQKRCRRLKAHYIDCQVEYKEIPIKLFFVRYSGQTGWKIITTSELTANFIKTLEIYSIRWSIEVFFKEAKQHLQLGKSQSRDFDAQIADITITLIQYLLLVLCKRFNSYETIGQIFEKESRQLLELTIAEKIWGLMLELVKEICEVMEVSVETLVEKLVDESSGAKVERLLSRLLGVTETEALKTAA
jgi:hypothetical protein